VPGSSGRAITPAPCATAYLMPDAIASGSRFAIAASEFSGSSYSSVTGTDRILARGATPMLPLAPPAPCPCPAIRPATAVPSKPQNGPPATRPEPA
jgi:hypothetical protein